MELETVNKLYLELSQIATAKTEKEALLNIEIADLKRMIKSRDYILEDIESALFGNVVKDRDYRCMAEEIRKIQYKATKYTEQKPNLYVQ